MKADRCWANKHVNERTIGTMATQAVRHLPERVREREETDVHRLENDTDGQEPDRAEALDRKGR